MKLYIGADDSTGSTLLQTWTGTSLPSAYTTPTTAYSSVYYLLWTTNGDGSVGTGFKLSYASMTCTSLPAFWPPPLRARVCLCVVAAAAHRRTLVPLDNCNPSLSGGVTVTITAAHGGFGDGSGMINYPAGDYYCDFVVKPTVVPHHFRIWLDLLDVSGAATYDYVRTQNSGRRTELGEMVDEAGRL